MKVGFFKSSLALSLSLYIFLLPLFVHLRNILIFPHIIRYQNPATEHPQNFTRSNMDPIVLRICSLLLIAFFNAVLAGCYGIARWITFRVPTRQIGGGTDLRQLIFSWLFFSLCLTELTLLAVGFSPIRGKIYDLYSQMRDPTTINIHNAVVGVVFAVAFAESGLLYWAGQVDGDGHRVSSLSANVDFLFISSHVFLTICAVLCVLVATSSGWQVQEPRRDFLISSFIKAGSALIAFELGCGFLLAAFITAMENGTRERDARERAARRNSL